MMTVMMTLMGNSNYDRMWGIGLFSGTHLTTGSIWELCNNGIVIEIYIFFHYMKDWNLAI